MVDEIKQPQEMIDALQQERDKVSVDGIEEPVFAAGETNGLGINDEGLIVHDEPVKDKEELFKTVSVEEAFQYLPIEEEKPVEKKEYHRDEDVDIVIPEKPADPLAELKEELPDIRPVEEEKKVEETPEMKKLRQKAEALDKIRHFLANDEDFNLWKGTGLNTGEEGKPVSNDIQLEENRPILTDSEEVPDKEVSRLIGTLSVPPTSPDGMIEFLSANPDALGDPSGSADDVPMGVNAMVMSLSEARELISQDYQKVEKALNEQETVLKQTLSLPNNNGYIKSRRAYIPKENGLLTGLQAKAAIMDALGLRSHFTVVLPHSGLVAVIAAPVAADIVDLQYVLDTTKIKQGRLYGGSNYGTTTWFFNNEIVELFIRKIVKINLKDPSVENIRRHLDPMDIPTIAWGLGCSMYPDGFNFNRVALLDDGSTKNIVGKLWLSDMEVFADNRFSTRQKQHLIAAPSTPSSDEEIDAYKRNWVKEDDVETFERTVLVREEEKRKGKVTKETILVLGQANMLDYVEHGSAWDAYLNEAINETLAMVPDETIRGSYLARKIRATELREYSHLIKKIKVRESYSYSSDVIESEIDARDVILATLDDMVLIPSAYEKTLEAVNDYINSRVKVIYGTPTVSDYEEKQHKGNPISNKIVPINPVICFFTLTAPIYRSLEPRLGR